MVASSTAQVAQLDALIEQVNVFLASLKSRRAEYEGQANLYRNVTRNVRRLPSDILVEIFFHTLDGDPEDIWRVIEVCWRWREVALAAPTLWSTFPVIYRKWQTTLSRLSMALKHSRSAPFQLSLSFWGFSSPVCPLRDLVSPHSRRITHLDIINPQESRAFFSSSTPVLVQWDALKFLQLQNVYTEPVRHLPVTLFQHSPLLEHVKVTTGMGTILSRINELLLPWHQLRQLSMARITLNCAISVLQSASMLEECDLYLAHSHTSLNIARFSHPSLSSLHVGVEDQQIVRKLFRSLTLPALRKLSVDVYRLDPAIISDFIEQSSCRLTFLNLPAIYFHRHHDPVAVNRLLSLLPNLTDLCLPCSIVFAQTTLRSLPSVTPHLRHLCLKYARGIEQATDATVRVNLSSALVEGLPPLETLVFPTSVLNPSILLHESRSGATYVGYLQQWNTELQNFVGFLEDRAALETDLDHIMSLMTFWRDMPSCFLCDKEGKEVIAKLEYILKQLSDDPRGHRDHISAILTKWSASSSEYLNAVGWTKAEGADVLVYGHRQGTSSIRIHERQSDRFASFELRNGYITL